MKTHLIKLPNGGSVLVTPNRSVQGLQVYFTFKAGSFNDPKGKLGVAHFCEHLLFGASTTNHSNEERRKMTTLFKKRNAATSEKCMIFYAHTVRKNFFKALDYFTDGFANILLNKDEVEKERCVILDEISVHRKNVNRRVMANLFNTACSLEPHRRKQIESPAGTVETVKRITIKDLRNFIDKYFSIGNMQINIVGNISKREAKKGVNLYVLPRMKQQGEVGYNPRDLQKDTLVNGKILSAKSIEKNRAFLVFAYKQGFQQFTGKLKDNKSYVDRVITQCLAEGFKEKMRYESGLCYHVYSGISKTDNVVRLEDVIACEDNKIDIILNQYFEYLKSLPPDLDRNCFEKHRQLICESVNYDVLTLEDIADATSRSYETYGITKIQDVSKYHLKRYKQLSFEEANARYRNLFKKIAFIAVISNDEKYQDAKFKEWLYNKIQNILKSKNKKLNQS